MSPSHTNRNAKPFHEARDRRGDGCFDRYSKNGEEIEVFRYFGDPRDYWVRSSRDRENRVYPSKSLVGYPLKKTELNGGWGQKS